MYEIVNKDKGILGAYEGIRTFRAKEEELLS